MSATPGGWPHLEDKLLPCNAAALLDPFGAASASCLPQAQINSH